MGQVIVEASIDMVSLTVAEFDRCRIRQRRREVPLVEETRLGLVEREARRLVEEGGDL